MLLLYPNLNEGVFSTRQKFVLVLLLKSISLPFSNLSFKNYLLFLKVCSAGCLQHHNYLGAGLTVWMPKPSSPWLRAPVSLEMGYGHLWFYSQAAQALLIYTDILKLLACLVFTWDFCEMDTMQENWINWMFLKLFFLHYTDCPLPPQIFILKGILWNTC